MNPQTTQFVDIQNEVKQTLGIVPHWFEHIPPEAASQMWGLMRDLQLGETNIPNKYKELIGLGVAAAVHCQYCTHFHTEAAKVHGATTQEIAEATTLASETLAFSTYLNGMQVDMDRFRNEMTQIVQHVKSQQGR